MTAVPIRLSDVPHGVPVLIHSLEHHPAAVRLLAMGLRPGVRVTVLRSTHSGQTLYLETPRQQYGLRRDEAMILWVTNLS
jgi:Fe2+ transport system protein FeoA